MKKQGFGQGDEQMLYRATCRIREIDLIEHSDDVQRELAHRLIDEMPIESLRAMLNFRSRRVCVFDTVEFEFEMSIKC